MTVVESSAEKGQLEPDYVKFTRPQPRPFVALRLAFLSLVLTLIASSVSTWLFVPEQYENAGYMISHWLAVQPGRCVGTIGIMITVILLQWMHNDLYTLGQYLNTFKHADEFADIPIVHSGDEDNPNFPAFMRRCRDASDPWFQRNNVIALWSARVAHVGIVGIVGVVYTFYYYHAGFFVLFVDGYWLSMWRTYLMYANHKTSTKWMQRIRVACLVIMVISVCVVGYAIIEMDHKSGFGLGGEIVALSCIIVFYLSMHGLVKTLQIDMQVELAAVITKRDEDQDGSKTAVVKQKSPQSQPGQETAVVSSKPWTVQMNNQRQTLVTSKMYSIRTNTKRRNAIRL